MLNQKREAKILVSSDCRGMLENIINKVQQLHQKNQFDFIILTGEVCNPRSAPYIAGLRANQHTLPIPAYFIDCSDLSPVLQQLHPHGQEIAPNLNYLGKYGVTKIRETVIAYFSHNHWQKDSPAQDQIQQFLEKTKGKKIDILLTNAWPKEAKQLSKLSEARCEDYVSRLAAVINPHYHIAAGSSQFYRMPPYINSEGFQSHFISVAPYEEPPRGKYLFGLTVKPGQEEAPTTVSNPIENPYASVIIKEADVIRRLQPVVSTNFNIRKEVDNSEIVVYFEGFPDWSRSSDITEFLERWGELKTIQVARQLVRGTKCGIVRFRSAECTASCLASSEKVPFHTKRIKFTKKTLKDSRRVEDCWFCKTKGDESLIVHEGRHSYLSLEKGPVSKYHLQLIPYTHVQTTGRLELQEKEELERTSQAITNYYTQNGYEVVVYERYLPLSQAINHTVVHIIPVKEKLLRKFQELNASDNLGFKPQRDEMRKSQYFIRVQIGGKTFIKEIGRKERVQADFMRIVISQLLGNARLANWKQCVREEEEIKQVRKDVQEVLKKIGLIMSSD